MGRSSTNKRLSNMEFSRIKKDSIEKTLEWILNVGTKLSWIME